MGKTKLIVREVFQGERSLEELIAPMILCIDESLTTITDIKYTDNQYSVPWYERTPAFPDGRQM